VKERLKMTNKPTITVLMMQHAEESAEKIEAQRARFKTAYGIIEQADLEAEYEAWVEESNK
jgi:hypothetical protein